MMEGRELDAVASFSCTSSEIPTMRVPITSWYTERLASHLPPPITWLPMRFLLAPLTVFAMGLATVPMLTSPLALGASPDRQGLIVLYDFDETGDTIQDSSGVGRPMDLQIGFPKQVERTQGRIKIKGKAGIISKSPAQKLIDAVKRSEAITVEAWLEPEKTKQSGPARIVSVSKDASNRNVTLGQDNDRFDVRLRSTQTSANGLPSLASPSKTVKTRLTHVVYTRSKSGLTQLFVDGKRVSQGKARGSLSNWAGMDRLAIGDEVSGGRTWLGTLHRIAIFSRELSASQIKQNHLNGPNGTLVEKVSPEQLAKQRAEQHFETRVAPLLAAQCLECHDSANRKGDFDLARKETAMSAIVPGSLEKSELWRTIKEGEMPLDRPELSEDDKQILEQWIRDGAAWTVDWIDPAVYVNETGKTENFVRRLTLDEYIRSVKAAVGVDIADEAKKRLPRDLRADGFQNTAYNLTVDLGHVEAYAELAKQIVAKMEVRPFAKRFWKASRVTDKDMRGLIEAMGKWILRGELYDEEVVLYRGISTTVVASGGDYDDAVAATIRAMLISPRFLYRIENQVGDGLPRPLDSQELAVRIAYIVWGSPPDDVLQKAADSGDLSEPSQLRRQVQRMLDDPRAIARSNDFITGWLNLNHLDSLRPGHDRFPKWNAGLAGDMRRETLAFFNHVVWEEKRPLADLLDAQVTFLTPELAEHYGIKPRGADFAKYDLYDVPERGGLISQGSVLTIGGDDASMVTRGLLVLQQLLRGVVNDPPPCVDTSPVPTKAGLSQRKIAEERIANESCGGCHSRFEPLAFGLEKFDGLGSFHHRDEHGNQLRDDGEILFPGTAKPVAFKDSAELMKMLAESDRVRESLVWKLTQFSLGRPLVAADAATVRQIHRQSLQAGGRYQDILTQIVMSDLVTHIRTSPE